MESWKHVWRKGFAPLISTAGLEALRRALIEDDKRLMQGATTSPPPLQAISEWPVEGACPITLCGWLGDDLSTVGEVEAYFGRMCREADQALGEPAAVRWFLNWVDDTPRDEVRRSLLPEVNLELAKRAEAEKTAC